MSVLDSEEVKLIIRISERLSALEIMVGNLRLQIDRVDKDVQLMTSHCNIEGKEQALVDKQLQKKIDRLEMKRLQYVWTISGAVAAAGAGGAVLWALFHDKIISLFKNW